jgi:hypothetical protein
MHPYGSFWFNVEDKLNTWFNNWTPAVLFVLFLIVCIAGVAYLCFGIAIIYLFYLFV